MSKLTSTDTETATQEADRLALELRERLPKNIIVKSRIRINGVRLFEDISLKADPKIPGRFRGRVLTTKATS